jgi:hypothetical protein
VQGVCIARRVIPTTDRVVTGEMHAEPGSDRGIRAVDGV